MRFEQKIAKSCWEFCHQGQSDSLLGNLVQADLGRFAPFATFCKNQGLSPKASA
jgi:hypothetical protein